MEVRHFPLNEVGNRYDGDIRKHALVESLYELQLLWKASGPRSYEVKVNIETERLHQRTSDKLARIRRWLYHGCLKGNNAARQLSQVRKS